jgi:hypothetical protein
MITVAGKRLAVRRIVYERQHGPLPSGVRLFARCRSKQCCNPSHMVRSDDTAAMAAFGLQMKTQVGAQHHHVRLTAEQVRAIRAQLAAGVSMSRLARELKVNVGTIHAIARGRTWKHLDATASDDPPVPDAG